jgi:hypothetical protein
MRRFRRRLAGCKKAVRRVRRRGSAGYRARVKTKHAQTDKQRGRKQGQRYQIGFDAVQIPHGGIGYRFSWNKFSARIDQRKA